MRLKIYVVLIFTVSLVSCQKEPSKNNTTPRRVQTQVVHEESLANKLLYSGSLEADRSYQLSFMVPGKLSSVKVEEGQKVEKNQPLATLEKDEYQQAYEAVKARYEQADDQYKRLKKMYESNSLTKGDFLEISSKRKEAKAKLTQSKKKLQRTVLRSPAAGVVERLSVSEGEAIKEGIPIITVVNIDHLFAVFNIPEGSMQLVEKGDSCRVSFGNLDINVPDKSSTITKIKPKADPLSRSFKAYAPIKNTGHQLKPGMLAQVSLAKKSTQKGIVVPPDLLVHQNNILKLWMITNGRATLKRVLTGRLRSSRIRITKGIQPGDTLITSGMNLHEGMEVEGAD